MLSLNQYQELASRTKAQYKSVTDQVVNGVLGLGGESGEVQDHVKKHLFQGHELDIEHVKNELGDILWYVALVADAFNMTLEEIAMFNVDKLMKRYPDGFSVERSVNREEALA